MKKLRKNLRKQLQKRMKKCPDNKDLVAKVVQLIQDKIPGGIGDGVPDTVFDPKQLEVGIQVEQEHTEDPDLAKEIAKDHLTEVENYYVNYQGKSRLKELEEKAKEEIKS